MKNNKRTGVRVLFYIGGLLIMTLGVAVSVKSDLGVSPVSSIPYTMTCVAGIDLGLGTIIFSAAMVLLQILLPTVRSNRRRQEVFFCVWKNPAL